MINSQLRYISVAIFCLASNFMTNSSLGADVANSSSDNPISSASVYFLTEKQIDDLSLLATQGDASSAVKLYKYYSMSNHNKEQALKWLKLAAAQGDTASQYNLAVIFEKNGNLECALYLAEVLAIKKDKDADDLIKSIRNAIKNNGNTLSKTPPS